MSQFIRETINLTPEMETYLVCFIVSNLLIPRHDIIISYTHFQDRQPEDLLLSHVYLDHKEQFFL